MCYRYLHKGTSLGDNITVIKCSNTLSARYENVVLYKQYFIHIYKQHVTPNIVYVLLE